MIYLKLIISLFMAGLGGKLGFRALMYSTIGALGAFSAYAFSKAWFKGMSSHLEKITASENAKVISLLFLTLVPVCVVTYVGRILIIRLHVTEKLDPLINSVLGAAYLFCVSLIILIIIGG
jgi:hypothetical protein